MKPTIGRVVHYYPTDHQDGQEPFAAIVSATTGNAPGETTLRVLPPAGDLFVAMARHSDEPTPGCWTWPPRV